MFNHYLVQLPPETVSIFVRALSLESKSYAVVILKQHEPLQLYSPWFAFDIATLSTTTDPSVVQQVYPDGIIPDDCNALNFLL